MTMNSLMKIMNYFMSSADKYLKFVLFIYSISKFTKFFINLLTV